MPFSANSRKAVGISNFGISNFGNSNFGASNAGVPMTAGLDFDLGAAAVLVSAMSIILACCGGRHVSGSPPSANRPDNIEVPSPGIEITPMPGQTNFWTSTPGFDAMQ